MTTALSSSRRPKVSFAALLITSYALAAAVLVLWLGGIEIIRLGPVGPWLFWPAQLAWLASVLLAFVLFRWRGAWTLVGLLFVAPGPIFLGFLTHACAVNGQCL